MFSFRSLPLVLLSLFLLALPARAERPNILFLFADDQRADSIGAHGNPHVKTPVLDRLSQRGFSFTNTYCMGSIHGAVCQPSRAMLNSGRTLYRVSMNLEDEKLLPEILGEAGYETFGTGKWHNGQASFLRGFQKGKAIFFGGMSDHLKVPARDLDENGKLVNFRIETRFSSELFADATIEFLQKRDRDRPFYAYVSFTSPHDPRQPPAEDLEPYDTEKLPLPENFLPQHPFHNGWMTGRDEALAAWPRTPEVIREQLAEYYGMITHLDRQVGRILEALEKTGQARNTVVIYTADHGLAMGSHGLLGKQNLYEHSMKAPLIIRGPGIPEGKSSPTLAYLFDLYPTICSLAGVGVPDGVEGRSLVPHWTGKDVQHRKSLFTTYEDVQRAVRTSRWKLIRYPKIHKTQLFDLEADPHEMRDVAADPANAETVKELWAELERWQAATGDRAPLTAKKKQSAEIDLTGRKRKPDRHQPEWIRKKYFE